MPQNSESVCPDSHFKIIGQITCKSFISWEIRIFNWRYNFHCISFTQGIQEPKSRSNSNAYQIGSYAFVTFKVYLFQVLYEFIYPVCFHSKICCLKSGYLHVLVELLCIKISISTYIFMFFCTAIIEIISDGMFVSRHQI